MSALLIRAGVVVTMDGQASLHRPGYLVVERGLLQEVGPLADMAGRHFDDALDWSDRLVMPGLVNAHTHSPMTLFRGIAEGHSLLTFEGWYNTIRVVEEVMDAEMVPPAVEVSCGEMIRTGTTCFADQYFYMDRIVPVVRKSGMRAALAYGVVELGDDISRERELASAAAFLESVQDDPRLKGWIGPHAFFVDNSPDAIALELELADRFDTGLHIHLSTSGEEDRFCQEQYGTTAVQQMEKLGILDRRLLAAHCLTMPEEDFELLGGRPFSAVVAASACMRAGADAAPLKAMRKAGINTALGTDNVTANNSYDMFKEMQIAGKLMSFRERTPNPIASYDIVEMATMGGARALGWDDRIGSLEAGKRADLIALDLNEIGWGPTNAQDVYTALVYSVSGMHVRDVMVDGDWLLRDGVLETVGYPEAVAALDAAYDELHRRIAQ